jgi:hypothetical protein
MRIEANIAAAIARWAGNAEALGYRVTAKVVAAKVACSVGYAARVLAGLRRRGLLLPVSESRRLSTDIDEGFRNDKPKDAPRSFSLGDQ